MTGLTAPAKFGTKAATVSLGSTGPSELTTARSGLSGVSEVSVVAPAARATIRAAAVRALIAARL